MIIAKLPSFSTEAPVDKIYPLFFSIIINTTNRANSLKVLLHALAHQSYSHFEVIVVVGPTPDHTMEVLQPYIEGGIQRLHVCHCPKHNLAQSRNIGLAAAQGEVVAYIDDDAVPCYNWLAQLAQLFADPVLDGTGGIVYLVHPNSPRLQHRVGITSSLAEQSDIRRSWLDQIIPDGTAYFWTARMMGTNMAFRRTALLEIGGFDEFYEWVYDDTDVALRLAAAGKVVLPVLQAPVYHIPASSQNRVAYTYVGRWWIQTKAAIYLTCKEGKEVSDPWQARFKRILHLVHGHWLGYRSLHREGKIQTRQFFSMQTQEIKASLVGLSAGLFGKRSLLSTTQPSPQQTMQPFQNQASALQPAINPINGEHSQLAIQEPPLRICLLSNAYPPNQYEGVGRHTNLLAKGLFALGHHVHVITRGEKEQVSFYDGAYVHQLASPNNRYSLYHTLPKLHYALNHSHAVYERIQSLILNDGVQVVHTPIWQVDGLVTARSHTLPVVVWPQTALRQVGSLQHNHDTDTRLVGEMEEALIKHAAHLVPCSQAFYHSTKKIYNIADTQSYSIIPHGIEPADESAIRPFDLQRTDDRLTVLYLGRLEKRKGILELFQAIPLVLEHLPNVRFIIAGSDNSQSDGFQQRTGQNYIQYFQKNYPHLSKASSKNRTQQDETSPVTFLGKVSEEELQARYQSCDLFVAPSIYESFGFIYVEAMNYAKPVIGCNAGGIPEVVDEGVTGLLVEPENGKALANAILDLLQSPKKLYEMGLAGRQRVLDKFTNIQMARSFEQVYRRVIAEFTK